MQGARRDGFAERSARANQSRAESRGVIEELGAERRAEVYRTDVEFASEDLGTERDSRWGSSHRWVESIRERYARGMPQLAIASELGISQSYVAVIVKKYGIVKGEKRAEGD